MNQTAIDPRADVENTDVFGEGCTVAAHAYVSRHSMIGNGVFIRRGAIVDAIVDDNADIGTLSSVTGGAYIGQGVIIPDGMHVRKTTVILDINTSSPPFVGEVPEGHTLRRVMHGGEEMLQAVRITPSNMYRENVCRIKAA